MFKLIMIAVLLVLGSVAKANIVICQTYTNASTGQTITTCTDGGYDNE